MSFAVMMLTLDSLPPNPYELIAKLIILDVQIFRFLAEGTEEASRYLSPLEWVNSLSTESLPCLILDSNV